MSSGVLSTATHRRPPLPSGPSLALTVADRPDVIAHGAVAFPAPSGHLRIDVVEPHDAPVADDLQGRLVPIGSG